MKLVDYEKYYHSGSEFIIPRDEFEKIIEENQRLNNVLNELEKDIKNLYTYGIKNNREQKDYLLNRLEGLKEFYELKESDK